MLFGEPLHRGLALYAQLRLERARLVVDTSVQHTTVVTTLMASRAIFLVHNSDREMWMPLVQLTRGRETDDPCSDNDDVVRVTHSPPEPDVYRSACYPRSPRRTL